MPPSQCILYALKHGSIGRVFVADEAAAYADRTEAVQAEMQALAKRIALLVHGPTAWQPSQRYDERFKPISDTNRTYKDILILLRVTKDQPILEQALRAHGIPYTISGRVGSYLVHNRQGSQLAFTSSYRAIRPLCLNRLTPLSMDRH